MSSNTNSWFLTFQEELSDDDLCFLKSLYNTPNGVRMMKNTKPSRIGDMTLPIHMPSFLQ